MAKTLGELAELSGAELRGDPAQSVHGVASIEAATRGMVAFLGDTRYRHLLPATKATAVILAPEAVDSCPAAALVTDNPYAAFARVAQALSVTDSDRRHGVDESATVHESASIHQTAFVGARAVVGAGATIGARASVGPGCVVGDRAYVGEDTSLVAGVTVWVDVEIGERCIIHPGAVIGSDGFGFARDGAEWIKIPQLGTVRIGDDVEIGANTTIDRGALDSTVIDAGVKLDNQVQVAHNVHIGAHTAVAGCVGIAGSARIGKRCTIAGGVGIAGHLDIVDDVHITAMSLVVKSIEEPGVYSSGTPLEPNTQWRKNFARFRRLDEMWRRLRALEKMGISSKK